MGKGSAPRHGKYDKPSASDRSPQEKYAANWDVIFGKNGEKEHICVEDEAKEKS
jgi:hypothetical protein